jgi:hypothetical protein
MRAIALVVVLLPSLASAESFAVAVNTPLRWYKAQSIGGSAYVGFRGHHAIRVNAARYVHTYSVEEIVSDLAAGGGYADDVSGRRVDLGVGWMYFPRRLWSGPTLEAGLLVRDQVRREQDEPVLVPEPVLTTDKLTVAGRGVVGWSWLLFDRAFVSVATGVAVGLASKKTYITRDDELLMYSRVHQRQTTFELFFRFGGAFDL